MEIGIENLVAFARQLGLAVAGAAALWAFVFLVCSRTCRSDTSQIIFHWIAGRLQWLMYGGIVLGTTSWLALSLFYEVFAHEGITLYPTAYEVMAAFPITAPGYLVLLVLSLVGLTVRWHSPRVFHRYALGYFLAQFLVLLSITSFSSAWSGEVSAEKAFFVLHSVHSIFTLGTVLVLDFLFLSAKSSRTLQQHIFPLFPWISAVIWIGLGIDFLSVALVFDDAVMLTSRFFFSQTVVGILIINGILLSGPITRKILSSLEHGFESIGKRWLLFADIAGTVSITSWSAITFIDFFPEVPLSYVQLIGIYLTVIAVLFVGHNLWERYDTAEPRLEGRV
ncbi:MAG: hypothetical protein WD049_08035 [Candidatus Paceibacterota bacterium]